MIMTSALSMPANILKRMSTPVTRAMVAAIILSGIVAFLFKVLLSYHIGYRQPHFALACFYIEKEGKHR